MSQHRLLRTSIAAAVFTAVASVSFAQTPAPKNDDNNLGHLEDFKGSVMILQDKNYVNPVKDMKLFDGDKVIVLDKSESVVVITTRGQRCRIKIDENHTFTVRDKMCEALLLTVEAVTPAAVPGAVAPVAATADITGALVGAGVVGGAAIIGWQHPKGSPD